MSYEQSLSELGHSLYAKAAVLLICMRAESDDVTPANLAALFKAHSYAHLKRVYGKGFGIISYSRLVEWSGGKTKTRITLQRGYSVTVSGLDGHNPRTFSIRAKSQGKALQLARNRYAIKYLIAQCA